MTCREKLAIEHPDRIGNKWAGGCLGCPSGYGYMSTPDFCNIEECNKCWDREIPETEHSTDEKNVIYLIRIDFKISIPPCYYQAKSICVDRESNMVIVRGIVKFNDHSTDVDESIIPLDNVLMVSHKKIEVNDDVPAQDET